MSEDHSHQDHSPKYDSLETYLGIATGILFGIGLMTFVVSVNNLV